jgi:hypothetical protein
MGRSELRCFFFVFSSPTSFSSLASKIPPSLITPIFPLPDCSHPTKAPTPKTSPFPAAIHPHRAPSSSAQRTRSKTSLQNPKKKKITSQRKQRKEQPTPGAHLANSATQLCITLSGHTTRKGRVPVARKCAAKAIVWRVKIKCFAPRGLVRAGVNPHEHILAEVRQERSPSAPAPASSSAAVS